ncbi:MAG: hypothetical protein KF708_19450 [Pirellulales bacterium]|nr:hypothetical protein [Pirellulales bacterium]
MNLKQLKNQIRREVKASPQKAAMLGLALCVGLYFWTPMVWKLVRRSKPPAVQSADGTIDPQVLMSRLGTSLDALSKPTPTPERPWRMLAEEIDSNPLMARGGSLPEIRDPFNGTLAIVSPGRSLVAETEETRQAEIDPNAAGLKLSSTLIGPRRRLALINGDVYTVGSEIDLGNGVVFYVAEVSNNQVVLVRGDREFALVIPEKDRAGNGSRRLSAGP